MYKALIAAILLAPAAAFAPQQTVRAVGVKVDGCARTAREYRI